MLAGLGQEAFTEKAQSELGLEEGKTKEKLERVSQAEHRHREGRLQKAERRDWGYGQCSFPRAEESPQDQKAKVKKGMHSVSNPEEVCMQVWQ